MPFGVWLLAMMTPLTARVLMALGFSVVSIVGMDAVLTQLRTLMMSQFAGVPADAMNLALLGGFGEAMGIIFGAITTRLVLWRIANARRILGVNT